MTTLTSVYVAEPLVTTGRSSDRPYWIDQKIEVWHKSPDSQNLQFGHVQGSVQRNIDAVSSVSKTGVVAPGYIDIFYNKVHVSPPELNVGNLTSEVIRTVELWNAYLTPTTFNSITGTDEAVTINADSELPVAIPPLAFFNLTVNVGVLGPPNVDVSYMFDFSTDDDHEFRVFGRRVVVIPMSHNWKSSCVETLEFKTDIIESYNSTEQRVSLRERPRRTLKTRVRSLDGGKSRKISNLLYGWLPRVYGVPLWNDITRTTVDYFQGVSVLMCSTEGRDFVLGGLVVIMDPNESYETAVISGITPTSITLQVPFNNNWSKGARVCPIAIGHIKGNATVNYKTDNILDVSLPWDIRPQDDFIETYSTAEFAEYKGIEVLFKKPDWSKPVTTRMSSDAILIDNSQGPMIWDLKKETADLVQMMTLTSFSRSEYEEIRSFILRRKGRLKPFYMPSHTSDFTIANEDGLSDVQTVIEVINDDYVVFTEQRATIVIYTRGNDPLLRSIEDVSLSEGVASLALDEAIGVNVQYDDIVKISYLNLCRLDADKVAFEWFTDGVCKVKIAAKEVSM